jgi:hypothetical protein
VGAVLPVTTVVGEPLLLHPAKAALAATAPVPARNVRLERALFTISSTLFTVLLLVYFVPSCLFGF